MDNSKDPTFEPESIPRRTQITVEEASLPANSKEENVQEADSTTSSLMGSSLGWGSWGSFVQKAASGIVNKSTELVDFIKKDLSEFTETMQKDTAIIVNDATQTLKTKSVMEEAGKAADIVKSGITSFFGSINDALSVFDATNEQMEDENRPRYSRSHARLTSIQEDLNTFKKEPSGRPEDFEAWLSTFDLAKKRGDMDRLLDSVNSIQEAYNTLVPLTVSHNEFWQRYFYKVHQLEVDEKRIQSLMARSGEGTVEELDWGDDEGPSSPAMDPSEVSSVVSTESYQIVNKEESVGDGSKHSKKPSVGSLGDWEATSESDEDKTATSSIQQS